MAGRRPGLSRLGSPAGFQELSGISDFRGSSPRVGRAMMMPRSNPSEKDQFSLGQLGQRQGAVGQFAVGDAFGDEFTDERAGLAIGIGVERAGGGFDHIREGDEGGFARGRARAWVGKLGSQDILGGFGAQGAGFRVEVPDRGKPMVLGDDIAEGAGEPVLSCEFHAVGNVFDDALGADERIKLVVRGGPGVNSLPHHSQLLSAFT